MAVMHDIAFFQDKAPYLFKICQKNSRKKVFNCSGIDIVSVARTVSKASLLFLAATCSIVSWALRAQLPAANGLCD
jgi:hypothetical protein